MLAVPGAILALGPRLPVGARHRRSRPPRARAAARQRRGPSPAARAGRRRSRGHRSASRTARRRTCLRRTRSAPRRPARTHRRTSAAHGARVCAAGDGRSARGASGHGFARALALGRGGSPQRPARTPPAVAAPVPRLAGARRQRPDLLADRQHRLLSRRQPRLEPDAVAVDLHVLRPRAALDRRDAADAAPARAHRGGGRRRPEGRRRGRAGVAASCSRARAGAARRSIAV